MIDRRKLAVDHLTSLLERDLLEVDVYRRLVDRVLATTSDAELAILLANIPEQEPLTLRCRDGVVREAPLRVPAMAVFTCDSGVMKVDLSAAEFASEVDLDVECDGGVLTVVLPRDIAVEVDGRSGEGGVSVNRAKSRPVSPLARVHVYIHNGGGVVRLRHPHDRLRFWRRAP